MSAEKFLTGATTVRITASDIHPLQLQKKTPNLTSQPSLAGSGTMNTLIRDKLLFGAAFLLLPFVYRSLGKNH